MAARAAINARTIAPYTAPEIPATVVAAFFAADSALEAAVLASEATLPTFDTSVLSAFKDDCNVLTVDCREATVDCNAAMSLFRALTALLTLLTSDLTDAMADASEATSLFRAAIALFVAFMSTPCAERVKRSERQGRCLEHQLLRLSSLS